MEATQKLFKAIENDNYAQAKQQLHSAVNSIVAEKIEAEKERIRTQLSDK